MMDLTSRLLRIGIFYDGNYFYHVSNYYCYAHPKRCRLSIPGLHEFVRKMIALKENYDESLCQIVDCHYFRGRLPAMEANARQILLNERVFDDILMREGVVTHYLPINHGQEKGVDVSLALEALEQTIFKHFNVVVLIASDGDYVPLVRKLNALGTRVMVLGWDFEYVDDNGNPRNTATSGKLLSEVSYPIRVADYIDGRSTLNGMNVEKLFVSSSMQNFNQADDPCNPDELPENDDADCMAPEEGNGYRNYGRLIQLKNGYGFIAPENGNKNLFFFWEDLENCDFNQLRLDDRVVYEIGRNARGECAKHISLAEDQGNYGNDSETRE